MGGLANTGQSAVVSASCLEWHGAARSFVQGPRQDQGAAEDAFA